MREGVKTACRICGNEAGNRPFVAREMMYGTRETFDYFECGGCGTLQIAEVPSDLARHYPSGYYSYSPAKPLKGHFRRFTRNLKYRYILFNEGWLGGFLYRRKPDPYGVLRSYSKIGVTKASRILDVGCGSGRDLHKLREHGFENLLGVDPYLPASIRYGNGLEVRKCELSEVGGRWDVVYFNHVFEHLPDPAASLAVVASMLAPGGHCVLRIPVVPCHAWDTYGPDWVQLDAPRHLYTFSGKAIAILAAGAGLELDERMTYRDSPADQFWGSELYRRGVSLVDGAANLKVHFSRKELQRYREMARELNAKGTGDQAVFFLRMPA